MKMRSSQLHVIPNLMGNSNVHNNGKFQRFQELFSVNQMGTWIFGTLDITPALSDLLPRSKMLGKRR